VGADRSYPQGEGRRPLSGAGSSCARASRHERRVLRRLERRRRAREGNGRHPGATSPASPRTARAA
jgi:hypothetical protein